MAKTALVIHPYLKIWAGAEFLCLCVLKALVEDGYTVKLFSDTNDMKKAAEIYPEVSGVLGEVEWIEVPKIPTFKKFLPPVMRMIWASFNDKRIFQMLQTQKFDVIFHTQSSVFPTPESPTIHFSYDPKDLFSLSPYSGESVYHWRPELTGISQSSTWVEGRNRMRRIVRKIIRIAMPKPDLVCTPSTKTQQFLQRRKKMGNVEFFIPAARQSSPLAKKRQVIQVSRLVHFKRVEIFLEAARKLSREKFVLIGRIAKEEESYGRKILRDLPENVEYIDGNLKDNIDRLRESAVYLHTGKEIAMMLTVAEAVSAGCYPIVSRDSGSYDVVKRVTGVGSSFASFNEMIQKVDEALNSNFDIQSLSKSAEPFSIDNFKDWTRTVAKQVSNHA